MPSSLETTSLRIYSKYYNLSARSLTSFLSARLQPIDDYTQLWVAIIVDRFAVQVDNAANLCFIIVRF